MQDYMIFSSARDMWKKKYFEEKKRTGPLEDHTNRLHNELEALHRRRMNILEGPKDKNMKVIDTGPSEKVSFHLSFKFACYSHPS